MALDTIQSVVWPPSDTPLEHAGWQLPGRRNRLVCTELHYRWCDRCFRFGLAADRDGVLCAADGVEIDCKIIR